MREIKFRAWDRKRKKMTTPFGLKDFDGDYFIPESTNLVFGAEGEFEDKKKLQPLVSHGERLCSREMITHAKNVECEEFRFKRTISSHSSIFPTCDGYYQTAGRSAFPAIVKRLPSDVGDKNYMPHLTKAIEDARAQGWKQRLPEFVLNTTVVSNPDLLDPAFFQALGKARRWRAPESRDSENRPNGEWVDKWVDFTIHLAEGKSAEEFFATLV